MYGLKRPLINVLQTMMLECMDYQHLTKVEVQRAGRSFSD